MRDDGTVFHRAVKLGMVQGGDPMSKDPARRNQYGSGGLRMLKAEITSEPQSRGAVSAVLIPGDADSAGAQFFINVADQPGLQGKYTVFGRVVEGIEVVGRISEAAVDESGKVVDRIEIKGVTLRDRPAEPFTAASVDELATYRAVLETSLGEISVELLPDKAPGARQEFSAARASRSLRRDRLPPRRSRLRDSDRIHAHEAESADPGPGSLRAHACARIQRHAAREGHPLDGPWR